MDYGSARKGGHSNGQRVDKGMEERRVQDMDRRTNVKGKAEQDHGSRHSPKRMEKWPPPGVWVRTDIDSTSRTQKQTLAGNTKKSKQYCGIQNAAVGRRYELQHRGG